MSYQTRLGLHPPAITVSFTPVRRAPRLGRTNYLEIVWDHFWVQRYLILRSTPGVHSNQNPQWAQKPRYNPIFTHHIRSWLLCSPRDSTRVNLALEREKTLKNTRHNKISTIQIASILFSSHRYRKKIKSISILVRYPITNWRMHKYAHKINFVGSIHIERTYLVRTSYS